MLDDQTVSAYLERIGAERPDRLDAAALRHLHERHSLSVPFETIDYHLGKEIMLDERVVEKIVHQPPVRADPHGAHRVVVRRRERPAEPDPALVQGDVETERLQQVVDRGVDLAAAAAPLLLY